MHFSEFYDVMNTTGISCIEFSVRDSEKYTNCFTGVNINGRKLEFYIVDDTCDFYQGYDSLNEMVTSPFFDGKSLMVIWDMIDIKFINGVPEKDFNAETDVTNIYMLLKEKGDVILQYKPTKIDIFIYIFKYLFSTCLVMLVPFFLLAIFNIMNWRGMYFFSGIILFCLVLTSYVAVKANSNTEYIITTKSIEKIMGVMVYVIPYSNIRKIKLHRSLINKNKGTIKIYVKQGLSINYHLERINNPKEIYNLILTLMKENSY